VTRNMTWCLRRRESTDFIQSNSQLDPLLARILWARHIDQPATIYTFVNGELEIADPFHLKGMECAVIRLQQAIAVHEKVVVYGDFDADGVCATALLTNALAALGAEVHAYIPDRFSEAYGLNTPALERLYAEGTRLVVTVDCGVRSVAEVEAARNLGLDIIITDHHSVAGTIPPALVIINPKQPECEYPFKELSGVGLAYQLVRALCSGDIRERIGDDFLDLVAIGTVSDVVPLVGENRLLVQRGVRALRQTRRPGLLALMRSAGISPETVTSEGIAFRLGPRINAAGRLRSADLALAILTVEDPEQAEVLAGKLSSVNTERQTLLEKQVALARQSLGEFDGQPLLLVADPGFHEGLVGLVASRLCEEYYRPALVLKNGDEYARGSARSIEGLHITAALDTCADLLLRYGGHARAAGFTLANANLDAFQKRLTASITSQVQADTFQQRLLVDAIIPLALITGQTPAALNVLEPLGEGNSEPAFATLGLQLTRMRTLGADGKHLRLEVSDGARTFPVIAFRQGDQASALKVGQLIDLVYRPTYQEWQGQTTLQLVAQGVRPCENKR
jgi:single-stranded-DNA-specific exonuclease